MYSSPNANFSNQLKRRKLAKPMIFDIVQVLCIIMDQDLVVVKKKNAKNETGQHPAILTKQAQSII